MKTEDFDFELPSNLIAQTPLEKRDGSKLLVLDKESGEITHKHFTDIVDYLNTGDILVINDTKVIPARLYGIKEETNAIIEILMLKDIGNDRWECLVKPAKRIKIGTIVKFSDKLSAKCIEVKDEGIRIFEFIYSGILFEILDELGTMPLPPYIHEKLKDKNRYQTIYAKNEGSAAAPTAGLHFTKELLNKIKEKGVIIAPITLHVGLGTFRPVNVTDVTNHKANKGPAILITSKIQINFSRISPDKISQSLSKSLMRPKLVASLSILLKLIHSSILKSKFCLFLFLLASA